MAQPPKVINLNNYRFKQIKQSLPLGLGEFSGKEQLFILADKYPVFKLKVTGLNIFDFGYIAFEIASTLNPKRERCYEKILVFLLIEEQMGEITSINYYLSSADIEKEFAVYLVKALVVRLMNGGRYKFIKTRDLRVSKFMGRKYFDRSGGK